METEWEKAKIRMRLKKLPAKALLKKYRYAVDLGYGFRMEKNIREARLTAKAGYGDIYSLKDLSKKKLKKVI